MPRNTLQPLSIHNEGSILQSSLEESVVTYFDYSIIRALLILSLPEMYRRFENLKILLLCTFLTIKSQYMLSFQLLLLDLRFLLLSPFLVKKKENSCSTLSIYTSLQLTVLNFLRYVNMHFIMFCQIDVRV